MAAGKRDRVRQYLIDNFVHLGAHTAVPGERQLADLLDVSRMTVRSAINELEADGVLYRRPGAGTFVSIPRISKNLGLSSFSEDMRARGMEPGTRVAKATLMQAGTKVAQRLQISPQDDVVYIERIRLADGAPMCFEREWFPARLFPGLEDEDFSGSLYELLKERYGVVIVQAKQVVQATVLNEEEAEALEIPVGSPALHTRRIAYPADGVPTELAESLYRADRYRFDFMIKRSGA